MSEAARDERSDATLRSSNAILGQPLLANEGDTDYVSGYGMIQEGLTYLTADQIEVLLHPPDRSELSWPTTPRPATMELPDPGSPQDTFSYTATLWGPMNGPLQGLMLELDAGEHPAGRTSAPALFSQVTQGETTWEMVADHVEFPARSNDRSQEGAFARGVPSAIGNVDTAEFERALGLWFGDILIGQVFENDPTHGIVLHLADESWIAFMVWFRTA